MATSGELDRAVDAVSFAAPAPAVLITLGLTAGGGGGGGGFCKLALFKEIFSGVAVGSCGAFFSSKGSDS